MARTGRRTPSPLLRWSGVLVGALCLLPLLYLGYRALAGGGLVDVLLRPRSLGVAGRTILLTGAVGATSVVLGLGLAWLTARTDLPGRRWLTGLLAAPLAVPSYVAAFAVTTALGPRGLLQQFLEPWTGWERLPEIYGFPGALLVLSVLNYPYVFLAVRARLAVMDEAVDDAARVLGAGPFRRFRMITLPLIAGPLWSGGLLAALYTLSDFGAVSLLRYETFTWAIYNQYRGSLDRHTAAGLALMLVLAALLLLLGAERFRSRSRPAATSSVRARPPQPARLGRLRWPALAIAVSVLIPALVLPVAVCLHWLLQAPAGAGTGLAAAFARSGLASLLAALATTALAIPVAFLAARHPSKRTAFLRGIAHIGFGLPGLVLGLALVHFSVHLVPFLYQTLGLLVFAYAIHSLPQGFAPLEATLAPLSPRLDDAARALGAGWFRRHLRVTLPLLRPGFVSALALVFLTTVKELPATLMLAPTGFRTLATTVWSAAENVEMGRAAAASLLLLGLALAMLLLVLRPGRPLRPAVR